MPLRGRGPRSTARSSAAMVRARVPAGAPRRSNGCLSKARRFTGASPPSAASAARRANTPAGVSASASPPESSTATFQRPSAASTRRASARSGATGNWSCAHQNGFAQRDRDRECLLLALPPDEGSRRRRHGARQSQRGAHARPSVVAAAGTPDTSRSRPPAVGGGKRDNPRTMPMRPIAHAWRTADGLRRVQSVRRPHQVPSCTSRSVSVGQHHGTSGSLARRPTASPVTSWSSLPRSPGCRSGWRAARLGPRSAAGARPVRSCRVANLRPFRARG